MARPQQASSKALLVTLTIGHMVNDFYGLVLPFLLPTLIVAFNMNFAAAGLLALVTDLLGGILQPFSGFAGDRFAKRKSIIICGFLAFIIGLALVGVSTSYSMILFAWLVYGFGSAAFHPQSTNLLTRTYIYAKGRAMGIHGIGGAIGNFSAPLVITFFVTVIGWRSTSFFLIIPGIAATLLVVRIVHEPQNTSTESVRWHIPPSLWLLSLTFGLIYMAYKSFLTFLPTFLVQQGSTLSQAGYIASIMLFAGFIAQPLGGSIYDHIGGRWLFAISAALSAVALVVFNMSDGISDLISIAIFGAGISATFPVSLAMASDIAGSESIGLNTGIVFGLSGVLAALTPAITGYMADTIGLEAALEWLIVFPSVALLTSLFLPNHQKLVSTR